LNGWLFGNPEGEGKVLQLLEEAKGFSSNFFNRQEAKLLELAKANCKGLYQQTLIQPLLHKYGSELEEDLSLDLVEVMGQIQKVLVSAKRFLWVYCQVGERDDGFSQQRFLTCFKDHFQLYIEQGNLQAWFNSYFKFSVSRYFDSILEEAIKEQKRDMMEEDEEKPLAQNADLEFNFLLYC